MRLDVSAMRAYYGSPLGMVTRRLLNSVLSPHCTKTKGQVVMGLGYASPYLRAHLGRAERVLSLMPAGQGVIHWPPEGPSVSTLVDDAELPLPDQSVDWIFAVHSFEMADTLPYTLGEVWRVLKPNGRLVAIVPNRRGLWARFDNTPFGHGRPFSRGQLRGQLEDALLTPETWAEALFFPPLSSRFVLRSANLAEKVGRSTIGIMSGVLVVEASKQVFHRAIAEQTRRLVPRLGPILVPAPQPSSFSSEQTWPGQRPG